MNDEAETPIYVAVAIPRSDAIGMTVANVRITTGGTHIRRMSEDQAKAFGQLVVEAASLELPE